MWRSVLTNAALGALLVGCQASPASPSAVPSATESATVTLPSAGEPSATAGTAGRLTLVGRLGMTRAAHTATTLLDGRVLIAGGCTEYSCEGITATTELLDAATGATTRGPAMLQPRVGQGAVLLPDGRVLMIGGFQTGAVTESTELFDPAGNTFSAGPALLEARADPVVFLLADGSVLVAGGFARHTSIASAERLDPGLTAFQATGAMSAPRSGDGGALLADGRAIVIGGNTRGDTGTLLASAEVYDPFVGAWSATGNMSVPRHKHAVVALADGRVLVLGGSDEQDAFGQYRSAEVYDPVTGTFTSTGDMAAPRYKISSAVVRLADGRVLVAGGSHSAEVFDPVRGRFDVVPGEADAGFNFSAANLLPDGTVLVSGGYDAGIHLIDQVLRFVP